MRVWYFWVATVSGLGVCGAVEPTLDPVPDRIGNLLAEYCFECHDSAMEKGGVNLDLFEIDWSDPSSSGLWEKAHNVLSYQQMPPIDQPQPTAEEKQELLTWLDRELRDHTEFGGTLPRRLNRLEYRNSIRTVFQIDDYELPAGFPRDTRYHGFDTMAEALVLSPPLLEGYQTVAQDIADRLFREQGPLPEPITWEAGIEDLVLSFSASTLHGDALRLAAGSRDSIMRSCTWPSKIEMRHSGVYRISVDVSAFRSKLGESAEPMVLEVRARSIEASDRSGVAAFRLLHTSEITSESPQTVTFEAELYERETVLLHWANAELTHRPEDFAALLKARFEAEPRFLAAWQRMLFPEGKRRTSVASLRGRNGWEILMRHYEDPDLDLSTATMDHRLTEQALKLAMDVAAVRNLGDTYTYHYHENGPALQIHGVEVTGPSRLVEGPRDRQAREWREHSFGTRKEGESDEVYARRGLSLFLPRLFRRPVDAETREAFLNIAREHWEAGHSFEEGMHLVLRKALVSPRFLYRELDPGALDQHDLASRIAYFLTRHPPTAAIVHHARAGRLADPELVRSEAERLLPNSYDAPMVIDFTEQWLHTRLLTEIMPDASFDFSAEEVDIAKREVERHFFEMLDQNLPLRDFIDPDFIYTSKRFAEENYDYDIPDVKLAHATRVYARDHTKIERLPIERGGVRGGLLSSAAVMMATANGVDTQPVLRGVWMVENILGVPLPPVPSDVPALTPDTTAATTPRELLVEHTRAADCRGCHRHIDPIGFVLENFDPVGKWRETWPKVDVPIDPSGQLPDGTEVEGFTDFKSWVAENIDLFGQCLAEKLMRYATGRELSYAEQREVEQIVEGVLDRDGGFRDLVLDLVMSETFRTR